jgi:hypothetical protein
VAWNRNHSKAMAVLDRTRVTPSQLLGLLPGRCLSSSGNAVRIPLANKSRVYSALYHDGPALSKLIEFLNRCTTHDLHSEACLIWPFHIETLASIFDYGEAAQKMDPFPAMTPLRPTMAHLWLSVAL